MLTKSGRARRVQGVKGFEVEAAEKYDAQDLDGCNMACVFSGLS